MTTDTTAPGYWLNWRFLLCAIWILAAMVFSALLIWRYEGAKESNTRQRETQAEIMGSLYEDEAWRTSTIIFRPAWLLAYRIIAFSALFALLAADISINGGGIFYFYTQWTFAVVTIYFGLASSISMYGCLRHRNHVSCEVAHYDGTDAERGRYVAPSLGDNGNVSIMPRSLNSNGEPCNHEAAGLLGYTFQIIFQMCAGAVTLTDIVFWLIIYPFLTAKDYKLTFLIVCMHSVNAVFLLGDVILNNLRFPFFRIAYFVLWTCIFVIVQWIIHVCVPMWWPYPFLDLSSPYAPLWYLAVGLLHLPCFGIFALIVRTKQFCLSRLFKNR